MIPWIARNLFYFPIYAVRGEKVRKYLKAVRAYHRLSYSEMREWQWKKLKALLEFTYRHNSYYRELFDKNDINIDRIETPKDFRNIPVLTKDIIRANQQKIISKVNQKVSKRKTSGSIGIPLLFVKDRDASAYMEALTYDVLSWHGIDIGDRQSRFWGMPLIWSNRLRWKLKDLILNRKRLNSFKITERACLKYYKTLKRFKPKFIYGYPTAICEFIHSVHHSGLSADKLGVKVIIATGEMLFQEQRIQMERAFKCIVVNEYGTTENGLVAFQCPKGRMHLMTHNLYIEIINTENNMPAKSGEQGMVVLTELHSYKMPFIRYWLGDLAAPVEDSCSCGSALPLIDSIQGRVSDMVITADGRKMAGPIINYTMTKGVRRLKAIQTSIDNILIMIQPAGSFSDRQLLDIENKWRSLVGKNMNIRIQIVEEIPPDATGKLRSFESRIERKEKSA